MEVFRSRAPLRISFAGGGTDVNPFASLYGGFVLNVTINKYAYTSIVRTKSSNVSVTSYDFEKTTEFCSQSLATLENDACFVRSVYQHLMSKASGLDVITHNDAPPGSGLGSSSAMMVSIIGAFKEMENQVMSPYDIGRLAHDIERLELKQLGGMQDQYASAFGGFNFMEFDGDSVLVNRLKIDPWVVRELEYNMILVYTQKSRLSSNIIEDQIKNVKANKADNIDAMKQIKQHAQDMKRVLLTGKTNEFGELLHEAWQQKKMMASSITNDELDEMYDVAKKAGAIGGKVSGAGGGGFMMFYCESNKKRDVVSALEKMGARVESFKFELEGVESWRNVRSEQKFKRHFSPGFLAQQ
ncbi:MAG: GHMP kinase [Paraglaciecola sp.]|uniref:GHMP family kinase ATP-binding protein n=1 Tax=Paraglaciecola sp. TaxID=1920173 RepID=UPI003266B55E